MKVIWDHLEPVILEETFYMSGKLAYFVYTTVFLLSSAPVSAQISVKNSALLVDKIPVQPVAPLAQASGLQSGLVQALLNGAEFAAAAASLYFALTSLKRLSLFGRVARLSLGLACFVVALLLSSATSWTDLMGCGELLVSAN